MPQSKKRGQESDGSWFSRFMSFGKASNKAKSNQDAARKLTIEPYIYKPANVVANAHRVVPKGEPRSPAELMAKAEALKAVNLQAMRELRENGPPNCLGQNAKLSQGRLKITKSAPPRSNIKLLPWPISKIKNRAKKYRRGTTAQNAFM